MSVNSHSNSDTLASANCHPLAKSFHLNVHVYMWISIYIFNPYSSGRHISTKVEFPCAVSLAFSLTDPFHFQSYLGQCLSLMSFIEVILCICNEIRFFSNILWNILLAFPELLNFYFGHILKFTNNYLYFEVPWVLTNVSTAIGLQGIASLP